MNATLKKAVVLAAIGITALVGAINGEFSHFLFGMVAGWMSLLAAMWANDLRFGDKDEVAR